MSNTQPSQTAGPTQTAPTPYQTSGGTNSATSSAAAPASYGSAVAESGSAVQTSSQSSIDSTVPTGSDDSTAPDSTPTEQTSTATSQDAGGAIASIIAGYTNTASSQDPVQSSSASGSAESSVGEPGSDSTSVGDPAGSSATFTVPTDPSVTSASADPPTAAPVVSAGQQTTVGGVVVSAGNGYGSSSDPTSTPVAVIGSGTLQPGQATTVGGTQYSVSSNGAVVIGQSSPAPQNAVSVLSSAELAYTQAADPGESASSATLVTDHGMTVTGAVITISGQAYTATKVAASQYAIDSVTFSAGQPATLANSQVVSAGSSAIVIDGQTIPISAVGSASSASEEAVLVENSNTVTALQDPNQTGVAVISGATISIGGAPLTLDDGDAVSLASNGIVGVTETAAFSTVAAISQGSSSSSATAVSTASATAAASTEPLLHSQSSAPSSTGLQNGAVTSQARLLPWLCAICGIMVMIMI